MKKYHVATVSEDFRQYVQLHGLGVELDFFCMAENMEGSRYDSYRAEIEQLVRECGLAGSDMILHAPFNELHPAAIDPEALALIGKRMDQAYGICSSLGIDKMVVHSGYLPFVYFKSWHCDKSISFWGNFMRDKPETFTLCIENVLEDEPYMMAELMEKLRADGKHDNVGICLDTGHANCMSDIDVKVWIEVLAPYIKHIHIHNNDGKHDYHDSFDKGTLDMRELLEFADDICSENVTYTSEVIDCAAAVNWLQENKFI